MTALDYLADAFGWVRVAGLCVFFTLAAYIADFVTLPRCPKQIPAFGFGRGLVAHIKNSFAHLTCHRAWVRNGYAEYGRKGLPFALPAFISQPVDVVLPRSLTAWLMEQPESVVSAKLAHNSVLFSDYNFLSPRLIREDIAPRVASRFLPRYLAALIPAVDEEVQHAADGALRRVSEHEWTSVNLWQLWLDIVPPVTNRILVGEGLCRDEAFIAAMVGFTDAVNRNCLLLKMFPRALQPVVGRLLTVPNWLYWRSAHKKLAPVIQRRLVDMERQAAGDARYQAWQPPEDFITWMIRLAKQERKAWLLKPAELSTCLLPLEFASIHTTVLTGHSWMLDLLSMPSEAAILDVLADEIDGQAPAAGLPWTKATLQSLVRVDSSIRESQRISNFSDTLLERVVVAPSGLRHPDFDWTLPRGIHLTVNLDGTHHDELLYEDPLVYHPLRYAHMRERGGDGDGAKPQTLGMVSTSDRHLAFGHGRHACPGRFFVAHELKLIIAHLVRNYDFQPISQRPSSRWIGAIVVPPLGACIQVRRKRPRAKDLVSPMSKM
ncbi:hypothetical protein XA68_11840 [Ophiocordyceps unilateralis]|uniref:Cytochrome P450 n=1 Tax=Ophiocordyceps unilateralis TaxID=268505 RepID=A0A2A9PFY2_OPHUN|nr:hypothetical protein XA68_11840 [Ophiocordyceps unilateralis]